MAASTPVKREEVNIPPMQLQQQLPGATSSSPPVQMASAAAVSTHMPLLPPRNMYPVASSATATPPPPVTSTAQAVSSVNMLPLLTLQSLAGRPRDPRLARQVPIVQQQQMPGPQTTPPFHTPPVAQQPLAPSPSTTPPPPAAATSHPQAHQSSLGPLPGDAPPPHQPGQAAQSSATIATQPLAQPNSQPPQSFTLQPQDALLESIPRLSVKQEPPDVKALVETCKKRLEQIHQQQRVLNSKRMELTIECRTFIDALPFDNRREAIIKSLMAQLQTNLDASIMEDKELEQERNRIKTYLARQDALDANQSDGGLSSMLGLLNQATGATHGDPVYVSPREANNPKVTRVCQIFGVDRVPVLDFTTMKIDYTLIKLPTIHGSPTLDLGLDLTTPKPLIALKVVEQLETFLSRFKTVHVALLDDLIFDDVAYLYMERALGPLHGASYKAAMSNPKYSNKTWKDVQQCVTEYFQIDRARLEVFKHLVCIKPLTQFKETPRDFADRIESMIRVARAEAYSDIVIRAIIEAVPPAGYKLLEREMDGFPDVKDIRSLLNQMRRTSDLLEGTQATNPYELWLKAIHTNAPVRKVGTPTAKGTPSVPGPRPSPPPPNNSGRPHHHNGDDYRGGPGPSGSNHRGKHHNDNYPRREHGSKPYTRQPPPPPRNKEAQSGDSLCKEAMCVAKGYIHSADKCFSITSPKKYNAMLKNFLNPKSRS